MDKEPLKFGDVSLGYFKHVSTTFSQFSTWSPVFLVMKKRQNVRSDMLLRRIVPILVLLKPLSGQGRGNETRTAIWARGRARATAQPRATFDIGLTYMRHT